MDPRTLLPPLPKELSKRNAARKGKKTKKLSYKERNNLLEKEINRLYEGQEFKNWLHLFDEIDTYYPDQEGGSSKKATQDDLKRWIGIEKQEHSHALTIKEIYAEPLEKEDKRKLGNRSIYLPFLKSLLLYSLSQEEGFTKEFTYSQFWLEMGMRNRFYTNEEIRKKLPEYDSEITEEDLDDFFRRTGIKNKNITDYLLDSLSDECLLRYRKVLMIKESGRDAREATPEEVSIIESEKKRIMTEMGFRTTQDIYLAGQSRALYQKVKAILGYGYYEKFVVIVYQEDVLKKGVMDYINEIKQTLNFLETKKQLNAKMIETDVSSAKKRHDKELQKLEDGYKEYEDDMAFGPYKGNKERYLKEKGNAIVKSDQYIDKFEKMDNYFTAINSPYIQLLKQIERDIQEEKDKKKELEDMSSDIQLDTPNNI